MKKAHKLKNSGASRFSNPDNDGGEGGSLPSFAAVNVRSASVHVLQPSHIAPGRKLQQPAADHHCFSFLYGARAAGRKSAGTTGGSKLLRTRRRWRLRTRCVRLSSHHVALGPGACHVTTRVSRTAVQCHVSWCRLFHPWRAACAGEGGREDAGAARHVRP